MSGSPALSDELQSAHKEKKEIIDKIEQYSAEIEQYQPEILNWSPQELAELSFEQRELYSIQVAAYSIYLTKKLNKLNSLANWLTARINMNIINSLHTDEKRYYTASDKRTAAISENEYAEYLEEVRINTQIKVDVLNQLPYQVQNLSKMLGVRHG